jgi:hypothetical protein
MSFAMATNARECSSKAHGRMPKLRFPSGRPRSIRVASDLTVITMFLRLGVTVARWAAPADLSRPEGGVVADPRVARGIERFSDLPVRFGTEIATRAREGERELLTADVL